MCLLLCPGRVREDEQKRDRPQRGQTLQPGSHRSRPRYCPMEEQRFWSRAVAVRVQTEGRGGGQGGRGVRCKDCRDITGLSHGRCSGSLESHRVQRKKRQEEKLKRREKKEIKERLWLVDVINSSEPAEPGSSGQRVQKHTKYRFNSASQKMVKFYIYRTGLEV